MWQASPAVPGGPWLQLLEALVLRGFHWLTLLTCLILGLQTSNSDSVLGLLPAGAPRRHHVIAANDFPDGANWTDPADGPLYAEATRLFRAALDTHGVDEARCRAMRCVR